MITENIAGYHSDLSNLPDQALVERIQGGDPIALFELKQRNQMRKAAQGQMAQQQTSQPTVAEQAIAESGIAAVPADNMRGFAAGGIVPFQEGGMIDELRRYLTIAGVPARQKLSLIDFARQNPSAVPELLSQFGASTPSGPPTQEQTEAEIRRALTLEAVPASQKMAVIEQSRQPFVPLPEEEPQVRAIPARTTPLPARESLPSQAMGVAKDVLGDLSEYNRAARPRYEDLDAEFAPQIEAARAEGDKLKEAGLRARYAAAATGRDIEDTFEGLKGFGRAAFETPPAGGVESFIQGLTGTEDSLADIFGKSAKAYADWWRGGEAPTAAGPAPTPTESALPTPPSPADQPAAPKTDTGFKDPKRFDTPAPSAPAMPQVGVEDLAGASNEELVETREVAKERPDIFSPEALMALGFGMIAGGSKPGSSFGSAVGEGGLAMLKQVQSQRAAEAEREKEAMLEAGRMERTRMEQAGALQRAGINADAYKQAQLGISRANALEKRIAEYTDTKTRTPAQIQLGKQLVEQGRAKDEDEAYALAGRILDQQLAQLKQQYFDLTGTQAPSTYTQGIPGLPPGLTNPSYTPPAQ